MMTVHFFLAKQERLLRRRAPRNPPANLEASQSATVSSTSSSPECNAATPKRVSTSGAALTAYKEVRHEIPSSVNFWKKCS